MSKCDVGCKNETEGIRISLEDKFESTNLFDDIISNSDYTGNVRRKTFKKYCKDKQIKYFVKSEVNRKEQSSGIIKFQIEFFFYDISLYKPGDIIKEKEKTGKIEHRRLLYDLDTERLGTTTQHIYNDLKNEIDYFKTNSNQFKPIIKLTDFKDSDVSHGSPHSSEFPVWLTEKLNGDKLTNQIHYFYYEEEVSEQLDKNVISGSVEVKEDEKQIKIDFWLDNPDNQGTLTITAHYNNNDEETRKKVIEAVFQILLKENQ